MAQGKAFWLLKTEPSTYSFSQLIKDGKTHWNGVRNFQACNFIKQMKPGDLALIYHSGGDKAVVGVAEICSKPYKDEDPEGGDWFQVDLTPITALEKPVELKQIKALKSLSELLLVKQSRLSVMPVSKAHFELIRKMGKPTESWL